MFDRLLQIASSPRCLSQLIVGVDLIRVDLDRFVEMLKRTHLLPAFEVDKSELHMGVGVTGIHGCVVKKAFEVLPLSKCISKSSCFAAEETAKIHYRHNDKKR